MVEGVEDLEAFFLLRGSRGYMPANCQVLSLTRKEKNADLCRYIIAGSLAVTLEAFVRLESCIKVSSSITKRSLKASAYLVMKFLACPAVPAKFSIILLSLNTSPLTFLFYSTHN